GDGDSWADCWLPGSSGCWRRTPLPLSLCGHSLENIAATLVTGQIAQPEIHGIHAEIGRNLVQERFARETARQLSRRTQIARSQGKGFRLEPRDFFRDDP